jgi:hypothetical protein
MTQPSSYANAVTRNLHQQSKEDWLEKKIEELTTIIANLMQRMT